MIKLVSQFMLVATLIIWLLWDIVAYSQGGQGATLSVIITDFYYYSPSLGLFAGILIDHWFLPQFKSDLLLGRKKK